MSEKIFLSFMFFLLVVSLLTIYLFIPFGTGSFVLKTKNDSYNFGNISGNLQFYPNMRYPDFEISYRIQDCTIQKRDDMKRALDIVANKTVLNFYPVGTDEQIFVTCDSGGKMDGGLFIAGEGGPTNITKAGQYNIISSGRILLIRNSFCPNPNIAIHELLHALGFDHLQDSRNIMYPVSSCDQEIGEETIELINKIYSIPSYPDLLFEDVSAAMHGRYLDINISVRNNGFKTAGESKILIYADGNLKKEIDLGALEVGYGKAIVLKNVWIHQISVNKIEFYINSGFQELDKENNKISLFKDNN